MSTVRSQVGAVVVGEAVGSEVVGAAVGSEVVGEDVGEAVGSEVVGEVVGEAVGFDVVGEVVGEVVGDCVPSAMLHTVSATASMTVVSRAVASLKTNTPPSGEAMLAYKAFASASALAGATTRTEMLAAQRSATAALTSAGDSGNGRPSVMTTKTRCVPAWAPWYGSHEESFAALSMLAVLRRMPPPYATSMMSLRRVA